METLFLGDVCPTVVTAPLFSKKDTVTLFTDVPSIFKEKDFKFVNLECALTESDNAIKKIGPALKGPTETAEILKGLGVDCCGLSNNHVFDYGITGMKDTMLIRALEMIMSHPEEILCLNKTVKRYVLLQCVSTSIPMHWKIEWAQDHTMNMTPWRISEQQRQRMTELL